MDYIRTLVNDSYPTGWHFLLVEVNDDGSIYNLNFQFDHDPTTEEIQATVTNFGIATQYDKFVPIVFALAPHKDLLKWFILYIKDHPTITLNQYNTLLATKLWWESAVIRFFVYMLAVGLAEKYGVVLTAYTEVYILGQVRDWIVATPIKKIAKIVFNNHNEM